MDKSNTILTKAVDQFYKMSLFLAHDYFTKLINNKQVPDTDENYFKICIIAELSAHGIFDMATSANIQDWLNIPTEELVELIRYGRWLNPHTIKTVNTPIAQECHAVTAFTWMCCPHLDIYSGVSDKTNHHSWLVDPRDGTIYEPTPIARDTYFGFKMNDPYVFVMTEYENISRLKKEGLIPSPYCELFSQQLRKVLVRVKK